MQHLNLPQVMAVRTHQVVTFQGDGVAAWFATDMENRCLDRLSWNK